MRAIWRGNLWTVGETDGSAGPGRVLLTTLVGEVTKSARLNDQGLILDPTDDEAGEYCYACGSPTDQPGRLCGSCEHNEDDAHDADAADMREYYGDGE